MWTCKYCGKEFDFVRTTDKGNHAKHCNMNPKRAASYAKLEAAADIRFGAFVEFDVICECCKTYFTVTEREKLHPARDQYFCSRVCANSVGGKAKALKYGHDGGYRKIAFKYHGTKCIVCGFDKVVEVHHIDHNRENNSHSNLVPLCPNHHMMIHRSIYKEEVLTEIKKYFGAIV